MKDTDLLPDGAFIYRLLFKPELNHHELMQGFAILLADFLRPREGEIQNLSSGDRITLEVAQDRLNRERVALAVKHARQAYELFLEQYPQKIEEAREQLLSEILLRLSAEHKLPPGVNGIKGLLREYRRRAIKKTNARLKLPGPGGSSPQFDSKDLSRLYDLLYPQWKDAQRLHRQNRHLKTWMKIVQAAQSDLPDELVELLPRLPPSHIAVEHAARLCGLPAKRAATSFSPTYLLRLVRQQQASDQKR